MSTILDTDAVTAGLEPPLHPFTTGRRLVGEALGTGLLLAVVVGSGVMGERLCGGNVAIALLGNTLATGAALVVLITIFGPLSGAHFNPAVTLVFALRREIVPGLALAYVGVQVIGAVAGVFLAHLMFAEPVLQVSAKLRDGPAQASRSSSPPSALSARSSAASSSAPISRRSPSASTSRRPTGSRRRPRSPTRPSRSRGACRTRSQVLHQAPCRGSSSLRSLARSLAPRCSPGFSRSEE